MAVQFWRRSSAGRSAVHARTGMVASSQPLASTAGLHMLTSGGNACDAIVTMASVLNVVEPFSHPDCSWDRTKKVGKNESNG